MVSGPAAVKPKTPWLLPSMLPWVRGSFSGGFFGGRVVYMIHTDTDSDIFVLAFQVGST